jgi:hypothetical protein
MTEDGAADAGEDGTQESSADDAGDGCPHVELSMYQLSVAVRGGHDDTLDEVGEAARELMDYLTERSHELEERPDDRGLG